MRVVTGEAKGRKLKTPKTVGTRPIMDRVKTALFDILAPEVEDTRFLDLFAGTGSVGIEALSRGAAHATFIEMSAPIVKLVHENLLITGMSSRADVIHTDSFKFLQSCQVGPLPQTEKVRPLVLPKSNQVRTYDILYIAPPQYEELAARALALIDSSTLLSGASLAIVQIHPKERLGVAAISCRHLVLTDERRYGSTLLMFYRQNA